MEPNAKDIIKTMECCYTADGNCLDCPSQSDYDGCVGLTKNALALLKLQEQKIKELTEMHKMLSESYDHLEKTKDELLAERARLILENEAWQKQLITAEEQAGKAYYDLACEVEALRTENANLHASCTELTRKCASLNDENERLRAILDEAEIMVDDLKEKIPIAFDNESKKARADTVREMQERLKEYYSAPTYQPTKEHPIKHTQIEHLFHMINQIAKEMLEGEI